MIQISSDRTRRIAARGGSWISGIVRAIPAIVLVLGSLQMGGCATGTSALGPVFSPDGTRIAFVWIDTLGELAIGAGQRWSTAYALHWCETNEPAAMSSVAIGSVGGDRYLRVELQMEWSPDGSYMGVLTPDKLVIVEADSRRKVELRDGSITSFSWLSDSEVAYCTRRTEGGMQRHVICRQRVGDAEPTDVVAFDWHRRSDYTWQEHWAPSGQYVIVMDPKVRGQFHMVDVLAGASQSFGQTKAYAIGVAWAPDSSRAFCVSNKVGIVDEYEALLLEPATGKIVDCTENFQDVLADNRGPILGPLWTADGRYVLVNALRIGGHLIQPDPWRVVPLGPMFKSEFAAEYPEGTPWLFRLPVPGWVGVIPTGNWGNSPVIYVMDYSGEHTRPMPEATWSISPDGTVAAVAGRGKIVEVRSLGKWWE